jgi:lysophospholipase L1-like esterase
MGISGDTVHGLLDRLDPVLACTPRQVFVLAGINDLKNGCSVEQIAGDYQALIAKLHAANVDVFVQSVLYSSDLGLRQLKPKITALNTRLQEVCREHHATFVDLTPHLCAGQNMRSDFTVDGTHLSGAAYRVWAEALQSHLAALPGCDQPLALAH